MDLELKDKVAVVTGSARGIGKAIVIALAQEGVNVVVCDILTDTLQAVVEEAEGQGVKAVAYKLDVTKLDEAYKVAQSVMDEYGRIDILVNNAASLHPKSFWQCERADWEVDIGVGLYGTLNCCRAVIPHMMSQKSGRIVNMSSGAGRTGFTKQTAYVAAKSGIIGVTKSLAQEFAPYGIVVNAVAPGLVLTDMTRWYVEGEDKKRAEMHPEAAKQREKILNALTPLGRFGYPEDIANMVVILASAKATRYVTGQTISVDGGYVMV
jgi:NAD(P)-dependent dehydrogenase (short-subunit alcohol dehydrogenase family)